jgi:hypothetical protein
MVADADVAKAVVIPVIVPALWAGRYLPISRAPGAGIGSVFRQMATRIGARQGEGKGFEEEETRADSRRRHRVDR